MRGPGTLHEQFLALHVRVEVGDEIAELLWNRVDTRSGEGSPRKVEIRVCVSTASAKPAFWSEAPWQTKRDDWYR